MIGRKFDKLTVLANAPKTKDGKVQWACSCSCGKVKIVREYLLLKKSTRSCGCFAIEQTKIRNSLSLGQAAINYLYSSYRNGAKKRLKSFELTKEEFINLVASACHYCGTKPARNAMGPRTAKASSISSNILVNGIDRKDNSLGYISSNCLACCTECNYAKHNLTYEQFISYLNRLIEFRTST